MDRDPTILAEDRQSWWLSAVVHFKLISLISFIEYLLGSLNLFATNIFSCQIGSLGA
jgi:hypothetical protein